MNHKIIATRWEVKVEGSKRSIQLYDDTNNKIAGEDAIWNGGFHCSYNQLTSLEGAPSEVGGDFNCSNNQLTSLEGAPSEVGGYFNCSYNHLTSLEGAPSEVGGGFHCSNNQLTSLEGAPSEVGGYFDCSYNQLTSLEGAPSEVGGYFNCSYNHLTSLEGAPSEVGGYFHCSCNQLTSLEGAPSEHIKNIKPRINKIIFEKKLAKGFIFADGILSKLVSKKTLDEITVFKVESLGKRERSFVVQKGDLFSHGDSIQKAIDDLRYKVGDRDTSEFEPWRDNLNMVVSFENAIAAYRTVTGACEIGVRGFVESIQMPEKLTPKVIVEITKGRYGHDEFRDFLGG